AEFQVPATSLPSATAPQAVLKLLEVVEVSAPSPSAVLALPEVLLLRAPKPTPVLLPPVVSLTRASMPRKVLKSVSQPCSQVCDRRCGDRATQAMTPRRRRCGRQERLLEQLLNCNSSRRLD